MSGKKNTLIRRWARETNMPFRRAKKTWKKLSSEEKRNVTMQMEWELSTVRDRVDAKGDAHGTD